MTTTSDLKPEHQDLLERFGFDAELFERNRTKIREGKLSALSNIIQGDVAAPEEDAWTELAREDSVEGREAAEVGRAALEKGEVGAIVLNGGMATRFGGVVKGVVEALPGRSFLALKVQNFLQAGGPKCPVFLMNSFATDAATKRHCREQSDFGHEGLTHYTQGISIRLTREAEIYLDAEGAPSFYGPGHGDCTTFFRRSGCLDRFQEGGGKYLFLSNVDNLAARLDPLVIGTHILSGKQISAELAPKWPGDQGGAPVLVDERLWVVEGFRFPKDFDQDLVPVFNTNTFTINADALDQDFDLSSCYVEKKVDDSTVVQVETLVGELTRFLDTEYLRVSRTGKRSRFFPIKTPEDLLDGQEDLQSICDN